MFRNTDARLIRLRMRNATAQNSGGHFWMPEPFRILRLNRLPRFRTSSVGFAESNPPASFGRLFDFY